MSEMSIDAGNRLATEMTEKYPVMVYAMTKNAGDIPVGSKISSCRVISVKSSECEISYVTCRGDACSMPKRAIYKFNPPLQDKVYMLRLQSQICAPKLHWLFTKPLAFVILITCTLLTIATMGLGVARMTELLNKAPRLENQVAQIFGSAHNFAVVVLAAWCFAVVAHSIESAMAYRHCERTFQFSNQHSSYWALLVFLVGWPIFDELRELVEAKEMFAKKK